MSSKNVFTCDDCNCEMNEYQRYKSMAQISPSGNALEFQLWDDDQAQAPRMLHFCLDDHASRYLRNWMYERRDMQKKVEAPSESEFPSVDRLPVSGEVVDAEFDDGYPI